MSRARNVRRWVILSTLLGGGVSFAGGCSSSGSTGPGADGGSDGEVRDTGADGKTKDSGKDSGHDAGKDSGKDGNTGTGDTGSGDSGPDAKSPGDTGTDAPSDASSVVSTLTALTLPSAFAAIFDAVPDSAGTTIYFTALDATGNVGVFSVPVGSAAVAATTIATGSPFAAPFGIAIGSNDATLYVADPGGISTTSDSGNVFSLATTTGSTPAVVAGSIGTVPRGITVVKNGAADTLAFTGIDPTTGKPAVLELSAAGGTATTLLGGAPLVDPSGITVDGSGNFFVLDTIASGAALADLIEVPATGTPSVVLTSLFVGYPAGVATSEQGTIVVSGLTAPAGNDTLSSVTPAGVSTPLFAAGTAATSLAKLTGAAGLHRASAANVYAFVDSAGLSTDAVYVIK